MSGVSKKFKLKVLESRLNGRPQYLLAREVGADPAWMSRVMHGSVLSDQDSERLRKIGKRLGLSQQDVFA